MEQVIILIGDGYYDHAIDSINDIEITIENYNTIMKVVPYERQPEFLHLFIILSFLFAETALLEHFMLYDYDDLIIFIKEAKSKNWYLEELDVKTYISIRWLLDREIIKREDIDPLVLVEVDKRKSTLNQ